MVCLHHVYSRKSHPEYAEKIWNLMPLCFKCHELIHRFGTTSMAERFPEIKRFLTANGWEFFADKWRHSDEN